MPYIEAGEMAQCLRACTPVAEDPNSVPLTRQACASTTAGYPSSSSGLEDNHTQMPVLPRRHIGTHRFKIETQTRKLGAREIAQWLGALNCPCRKSGFGFWP